jgi:hypothetical protein
MLLHRSASTAQEEKAAPPPRQILLKRSTCASANKFQKPDEQKKEALKKIEDAYFNLETIYYFKLQEKDNAIASYNKLLQRFPQTEYEPEILYKLYLIYKDTEPAKSESYAKLLKEKHPESTFAKILENPDFLKQSSLAVEKQKELYKNAYEYFKAGDYAASSQLLTQASDLGQTAFTPSLELLKILIVGKTEDVAKYQYLP